MDFKDFEEQSVKKTQETWQIAGVQISFVAEGLSYLHIGEKGLPIEQVIKILQECIICRDSGGPQIYIEK